MSPWTAVRQAPLSVGFSRQESWRGLAISFSRESSWPKDQTHVSCVSCIGRQILYYCVTWEAPSLNVICLALSIYLKICGCLLMEIELIRSKSVIKLSVITWAYIWKPTILEYLQATCCWGFYSNKWIYFESVLGKLWWSAWCSIYSCGLKIKIRKVLVSKPELQYYVDMHSLNVTNETNNIFLLLCSSLDISRSKF